MAKLSKDTLMATSHKSMPRHGRDSVRPDRRTEILDATERLMVRSGYAAVSTRQVAREIGIKPSLVHYYFPTTDDLFLSLFRRGVEREAEKLDEAAQSPQAVAALWSTYCNQQRMALAVEFMALANHREAIRAEIVSSTRRERRRRAKLLSSMLDMKALQPAGCSAAGLSLLLIAVARSLIMEDGLGIDLGHRDASRFVEYWLGTLAKAPNAS